MCSTILLEHDWRGCAALTVIATLPDQLRYVGKVMSPSPSTGVCCHSSVYIIVVLVHSSSTSQMVPLCLPSVLCGAIHTPVAARAQQPRTCFHRDLFYWPVITAGSYDYQMTERLNGKASYVFNKDRFMPAGLSATTTTDTAHGTLISTASVDPQVTTKTVFLVAEPSPVELFCYTCGTYEYMNTTKYVCT